MRFGILGPLEVRDETGPIDLGRPKQRTLLALLVIHANRVVSTDAIVDELWSSEPPPSTSIDCTLPRASFTFGPP